MTIDLATVTKEVFEQEIGSVFELTAETNRTFDLELIEVTALDVEPGSRRQPFSLLFLAREKEALEQRILPLAHERLGQMEIFLVPIGFSKAGGMCYEAIFT